MRNRNFISRDLQAILQKNGLDAAIEIGADGKAVLHVSGNRGYAQSPPLSYVLTPQQMEILTNARQEGTGLRVKKAYNIFNSIVAKDFFPPQSYTLAYNVGIDRSGGRNRFTPVNMGWNGVNERMGRSTYSPTRRVDHRVDGSLRPGEATTTRQLPDGMYVPTAGYVWKNNAPMQQQQQPEQKPVVMDIEPMRAPRPKDGETVLLKDHISTAGNDTYPMLEDILRTHGIVIQEGKDQQGKDEKQLVLMAKNAKVNITYHLSEEEYAKLTADNWLSRGENSLEKRLEIINSKISLDFKEPVTKDMLNSINYVDLSYKDGRREVNEARYVEYELRQQARQEENRRVAELSEKRDAVRARIYNDPNAIDGRDVSQILQGKAFYAPRSSGRQLVVGEIRVDKTQNGSYAMTAEINGQLKSVGISEKDYKRFRDVLDDEHRLKMFAEKFDIKIDKGEDRSWDIVRGENGIHTEQEYRIADTMSASVNENILQQLGKGFYVQQKGGRQLDVTNIRAYDLNDPRISQHDREAIMKEVGIKEKDASKAYIIAADINGETIIHKMSEKQYRQYMDSDDMKRIKMADGIFDEFKIKNLPGRRGNAGKTILGILGGIAGVAVTGLSIKHVIDHPHPNRHSDHGRGYSTVPHFKWKGVPDLLDHHRGPGIPHHRGIPEIERPLEAMQRSVEAFERITEDVAVTVETVGNSLHK